MKKVLLSLLILFLGAPIFAQYYKTAIGIKGGYPGFGAINAKHFIGEKNALEASIASGKIGTTIQCLYEWQNSLPTEGLEWYYGVGPNIGIQSSALNNGSTLFFSGSGLLGIEYTFENIPLNIALDVGPVLNIIPTFQLKGGGGLAARYTIK